MRSYRWPVSGLVLSVAICGGRLPAQSDPVEQGGNLVRKIQDELEKFSKPELPKKRVLPGIPRVAARLDVMHVEARIDIEGSDNGMLGKNRVRLLIPCKFRYEIDLSEIRNGDVRFDASRNLVTVRMPPIQLVEPIPDRESMEEVERVNPWLRTKNSWWQLRESVMSEQLKPAARAKAEEGLDAAKAMGKTVLKDFLQKLYEPLDSNIQVIVE